MANFLISYYVNKYLFKCIQKTNKKPFIFNVLQGLENSCSKQLLSRFRYLKNTYYKNIFKVGFNGD